MSKEEIETFLKSKLNLQIGTIDDNGDPNIQPVSTIYRDNEKLLIITPKVAKKIKNLRN